jgi:hypothetical protein
MSWRNARLGYVLHIFVDGVHVVDAGQCSTSAIFGEMSCFAAVKAGSFGSSADVVLLYRNVCHPVVVGLGGVGVGVVLVLPSIVGGSGTGEVHWYLDIVVRRPRGVRGIVLWSLLLLWWSLLVLLWPSSPRAWSELALIVIEPSRVWQSSSSPDEFDHLAAFRNVDGPSFVFIVVLGKWYLDNFVENAWG